MGEVNVKREDPPPKRLPVEEITFGEVGSVYLRISDFDSDDNSVYIEAPQGGFYAWLLNPEEKKKRQTIDELIEALQQAKAALNEEAV
jgi:hypothetical protein